MRKPVAALCLSLCLGVGVIHAAPSADRLALRLQPLRGGVYVIEGAGGNTCFLVGPDGVLVVDSKREEAAADLLSLIRTVSDKPIRYLVNTTFDEDHVGGNATLGASATIIGHENTRQTMLARPAQYLREYPHRLDVALQSADVAEEQRLRRLIDWAKSATPATIAAPGLTFTSELGHARRSPWELRPALTIHLGSETVHLWATHAVTNGASETIPTGVDWRVSRTYAVVHFEEANVTCMSDLFFHDVVPFEFPGSGPLDRAALDRIIPHGVEAATFVPGHGAPGNLASVEAYARYISDVRKAVSAAKNAGQSRDEFLDEVDLPAYKDYDGYPVRFKENCAWQYDHFVTR